MRVAIITHLPDNVVAPAGGVAVGSMALLRGLARRPNVELHVLTDRSCRAAPYYLDALASKVYPVHPTPWLPGILDCVTLQRKRVERYLEEIEPDIVHVQGNACWIHPKRWPAVLTIRGIPERDVLFSPGPLRRFRSLMIRMIQGRDRSRYDHIIAISSYVEKQLGGQLRGCIYHIPNPVEVGFYTLPRRTVPNRVLLLGMIIPLKNIHGLLEAARIVCESVPSLSLHLAGALDRAPAYYEKMCGLLKEYGLDGQARFLGNLSREEVMCELAEAACLVLPSFQENLPMAVAEAMAAGVPVVASDVGGVADMVRDGETGYLIDPSRPDMIADRIERILMDPDLAGRFGRTAKEKAMVQHPDRVAEQTLEVYRRVLEMR